MESRNPLLAKDIINHIAGFSCYAMFGHLFAVPSAIRPGIREIEVKCGSILQAQLCRKMEIADTPPEQTDLELMRYQLEALLARVFDHSSMFWETYYRRMHLQPGRMQPGLSTVHIERDDLNDDPASQFSTRNAFPCFYIPLDVLHYADITRHTVYEPLILALQWYLHAWLNSSNCPSTRRESFAKSLNLLSALNAPQFREILIKQLQN